MSGQKRIGFRIPAGVIGTVQNTTEFAGIFTKDDVEFTATFRSQDFVFVMFAHGCDTIGENDARFQKIETPEKFDPAEREKTLRQIGESEVESPKTSLLH